MAKKTGRLSCRILKSYLQKDCARAIVILEGGSDDTIKKKDFISQQCKKAEVDHQFVESVGEAVELSKEFETIMPWIFTDNLLKDEESLKIQFPLASVFGTRVLIELCQRPNQEFHWNKKPVNSLLLRCSNVFVAGSEISSELLTAIYTTNGLVVEDESLSNYIFLKDFGASEEWPDQHYTAKIIKWKSEPGSAKKLVGKEFVNLLTSCSIPFSIERGDGDQSREKIPRASALEGLHFHLSKDINESSFESSLRSEGGAVCSSELRDGSMVVLQPGSPHYNEELLELRELGERIWVVSREWLETVTGGGSFTMPSLCVLEPSFKLASLKNVRIYVSTDVDEDLADEKKRGKMIVKLKSLGSVIVDAPQLADRAGMRVVVEKKEPNMIGMACLLKTANRSFGHDVGKEGFQCPLSHSIVESSQLDETAAAGLVFSVVGDQSVATFVKEVVTFCGGSMANKNEKDSSKRSTIVVFDETFKEGLGVAKNASNKLVYTVVGLNFIEAIINAKWNGKPNPASFRISRKSLSERLASTIERNETFGDDQGPQNDSNDGGQTDILKSRGRLSRAKTPGPSSTKRPRLQSSSPAREKQEQTRLPTVPKKVSTSPEIPVVDLIDEEKRNALARVRVDLSSKLQGNEEVRIQQEESVFHPTPLSKPASHFKDPFITDSNFLLTQILLKNFSLHGFFEGTIDDNRIDPLPKPDDPALGKVLALDDDGVFRVVVPTFRCGKTGIVQNYLGVLAAFPHAPLMVGLFQYTDPSQSSFRAKRIIESLKGSFVNLGIGTIAAVSSSPETLQLFTQVKGSLIPVVSVIGVDQGEEAGGHSAVAVVIKRQLLTIFDQMKTLPSSMSKYQVLELCSDDYCGSKEQPINRYAPYRSISVPNTELGDTHSYGFEVANFENKPSAPLIVKRNGTGNVRLIVPLADHYEELKLEEVTNKKVAALHGLHNKRILKETVGIQRICIQCAEQLKIASLKLFDPTNDSAKCASCNMAKGDRIPMVRVKKAESVRRCRLDWLRVRSFFTPIDFRQVFLSAMVNLCKSEAVRCRKLLKKSLLLEFFYKASINNWNWVDDKLIFVRDSQFNVYCKLYEKVYKICLHDYCFISCEENFCQLHEKQLF